MSAVIASSSDTGGARQTELVTPDSQTHITSTNQYMLPAAGPVKQVTRLIYFLLFFDMV